jgi:hypothetical protein
MLDEPLNNPDSANWYADEMPKLRMAAGKGSEARPLNIRGMRNSGAASSFPSDDASQRFKKGALLAAGVALALGLVYLCIDHLVVARVVLPSGTAGQQARHTLRRYLWSAPQRGDRVVTSDHSNLAVKRIIARPSDWLKLRDGLVYINGKKTDERLAPEKREILLQLGENQFYVVGGPTADGALSHGVVNRKDIVGRLAE